MSLLRVITHNVRLLPGVLGQGAVDRRRARALAERLCAAEPRYDIVALQEVFDERARALLSTALAADGFHLVPKCAGHGLLNQDSGLFFASRWPIVRHRFHEYAASAAASTDWLADKGVLGVELSSAAALDGLTLWVLDTHLQSSYRSPTEHAKVRAEQLVELREFVARLVRAADTRDCALLALGDFNVVGDGAEHGRMLGALGSVRDLFRAACPGDPGYSFDGQENLNLIDNDERLARERLDYLLAFDVRPAARFQDDDGTICHATPSPLARIEVERASIVRWGAPDACLSDHFGVEATISIARP